MPAQSGSRQGPDRGFPDSEVPSWGPNNKDCSILGSFLRSPLLRETTRFLPPLCYWFVVGNTGLYYIGIMLVGNMGMYFYAYIYICKDCIRIILLYSLPVPPPRNAEACCQVRQILWVAHLRTWQLLSSESACSSCACESAQPALHKL